ncbi:MAG: hypothetical protein RBR28_05475 [Lentimicrobium sp.]|jgi:hypothetical protein|nr:hypothetical protein [Lentimicrobium sp.]
MKTKLKEFRAIVSENCVSIILNTHRTSPDNQKDKLTLKNLIKEAEERLLKGKDIKRGKAMVERLNQLEETIDHRQNLESLLFFVNEDKSAFVRLPISVENRVVIGETFATRDLVRTMHLEEPYFVLVLSQQKVRLIEAFSDKVISENDTVFPIENTQFYSTNRVELSNATRQRNLLVEFFNRVDKQVNIIRKSNPLPVLICSEEGNYYEYLKVADQKGSIYKTYLNKNRLDEKAQAIVSDAWKIVKEAIIHKNNERKSELEKAVGAGNFLTDQNDIWKAIKDGRVQTLFIEQGIFQPAIVEDNVLTMASPQDWNKESFVDDIFDEMIELNMNFGGDVVFLSQGALDKFNGLAAVTRF